MLKSILLTFILFLALVAVAGQLSSVRGQTRRPTPTKRPRTTAKKPPANEVDASKAAAKDPAANENAIKEINGKIEENCKALIKTITIANLSPSELPYYTNERDPRYKCEEGRIKWTAVRYAGSSQIDHTSNVTVTVDVATLTQVFAQGTLVLFRSDGTIKVSIEGEEKNQLEWFLELRENKNAKSFAGTLQELIANLNARKELTAPKAE